MPIYNLNALYKKPVVKQIPRFAAFAKELDVETLCDAYIMLVERAPKRSLRTPRFKGRFPS